MRNLLTVTAVVGLMVCALSVVNDASAHAFLQSATPAVGSTVQRAPSQVVITFTEGVEPKFSTITVQDTSGAHVETGAAQIKGDEEHLAIGLNPLKPGVYKVIWHVTATDTHKTQGNFSFTLAQ